MMMRFSTVDGEVGGERRLYAAVNKFRQQCTDNSKCIQRHKRNPALAATIFKGDEQTSFFLSKLLIPQ